jgi:hypothetical protein
MGSGRRVAGYIVETTTYVDIHYNGLGLPRRPKSYADGDWQQAFQ